MHRHCKFTLKVVGVALLAWLLVFIIWFISGEGVQAPMRIDWGVTFSPRQTDYLGLDSGKVFQALLDDMGVRHLRLMAPWYQVEPVPGRYDFSDIDWYLREAQERDAKVVLAVGRKLFRWPECHEPDWARPLSSAEFEERILSLLRQEIDHFKEFDNIVGWQVENEALLPFGECTPKPNKDLLKKEISLVRSLDSRPVITTESGEISPWFRIGALVDRLGVSLYRVTNNPILGKIYYPFRPGFYQKKAILAKTINPNLQNIFLSELQLEPWGNKPLAEMTLQEQFKSMDLNRTRGNIEFAQRTGFSEIYIWGAEWWYWLKDKQKDDRFWELGKSLMK
ncbi:MAG: hypothetical protein Q8L21_02430 [Candidatus Komeilibacteria bacterium]|nr:hypothetical protein [Candidatus Komeilibacteria bacterium]